MSACFAPKNIWQSPPNAHAYRLLIFKDPTQKRQPLGSTPPRSAKPCIVAQLLLHFRTFSRFLLNSCSSPAISLTRYSFKSREENVQLVAGRFQYKSLTMTYFHTGIRTIIGAKSFHCPVRDGKEWYQLAMVIRHNFLLLGGFALIGRSGHCCFRSEFIESYQLNLIALWA